MEFLQVLRRNSCSNTSFGRGLQARVVLERERTANRGESHQMCDPPEETPRDTEEEMMLGLHKAEGSLTRPKASPSAMGFGA